MKGLVRKTVVRGKEELSRGCCFTWAPVMQPGAIQGPSRRVTELWGIMRDSRTQIVVSPSS